MMYNQCAVRSVRSAGTSRAPFKMRAVGYGLSVRMNRKRQAVRLYSPRAGHPQCQILPSSAICICHLPSGDNNIQHSKWIACCLLRFASGSLVLRSSIFEATVIAESRDQKHGQWNSQPGEHSPPQVFLTANRQLFKIHLAVSWGAEHS